MPGPGKLGDDDIAGLITRLQLATRRLLMTVEVLGDDDVATPSRLPDWTVGHVLTHLARNADGHAWMLTGAASGEVRDQYPGGPTARAAAIEEGASRPAAAVLADLRSAGAALEHCWLTLPASAWSRPVRPSGEVTPRPAHDLLRSRQRELELHHVDLDRGYRPADWPAEFAPPALDFLSARLAERGAQPALRLVAPATGREWQTGAAASVTLRGTPYALLGWLTGRSTGDDVAGERPANPPRWD